MSWGQDWTSLLCYSVNFHESTKRIAYQHYCTWANDLTTTIGHCLKVRRASKFVFLAWNGTLIHTDSHQLQSCHQIWQCCLYVHWLLSSYALKALLRPNLHNFREILGNWIYSLAWQIGYEYGEWGPPASNHCYCFGIETKYLVTCVTYSLFHLNLYVRSQKFLDLWLPCYLINALHSPNLHKLWVFPKCLFDWRVQ
jgi:hypothetical protein